MPTTTSIRRGRVVAYAILVTLLVTVTAYAFATAPAGTTPAPPPGGGSPAGPKFAPPYRPTEGKRPSIDIRCNENDPTGATLIFTFQPWDGSDGWLKIEDVHDEYDDAERAWSNGETKVLPNRQGVKVTYYSGSDDTDPDQPQGKDGVWVYNVVHGRCVAETPPTPPPPPPSIPPVEDDAPPPPVEEDEVPEFTPGPLPAPPVSAPEVTTPVTEPVPPTTTTEATVLAAVPTASSGRAPQTSLATTGSYILYALGAGAACVLAGMILRRRFAP